MGREWGSEERRVRCSFPAPTLTTVVRAHTSELPCRRPLPLTSTRRRAAGRIVCSLLNYSRLRMCEGPLPESPPSRPITAMQMQPFVRSLPTKAQCAVCRSLLFVTRTRLLTCKQTFRAISSYHRPRLWCAAPRSWALNRMIRHDALDITGMPLSSHFRPCYVQIGNFSTFMRTQKGIGSGPPGQNEQRARQRHV